MVITINIISTDQLWFEAGFTFYRCVIPVLFPRDFRLSKFILSRLGIVRLVIIRGRRGRRDGDAAYGDGGGRRRDVSVVRQGPMHR